MKFLFVVSLSLFPFVGLKGTSGFMTPELLSDSSGYVWLLWTHDYCFASAFFG